MRKAKAPRIRFNFERVENDKIKPAYCTIDDEVIKQDHITEMLKIVNEILINQNIPWERIKELKNA